MRFSQLHRGRERESPRRRVSRRDGTDVRLRTTPLAEDVRYTLAVHHIRDRADEPNVMPSEQRATFIRRNPERPLVVLGFSEGQGQTAANTGAATERIRPRR